MIPRLARRLTYNSGVAGKGIALLVAIFVAAGCGSARSHSTTRTNASQSIRPRPGPAVVTPRQVHRAFSRHGVRLVANYPNARPGPIVLADYRILGRRVPGSGNRPNGWVTVFDSAHDATTAKQRSRTVYGKRNVVIRANVLMEFRRDADRATRRQSTQALTAVAP